MIYKETELKKLKNEELKEILMNLNQPISGKKDLLVARILLASSNLNSESNEIDSPTVITTKEEEEEEEEEDVLTVKLSPNIIPSLVDDREKSPSLKRRRIEESVVMQEKNRSIRSPQVVDTGSPIQDQGETSGRDFELEDYDLEVELSPNDMYLDTINRKALDFDFERLCSVTLTHNNIYACLTCGKYFQGRGKSTPVYSHSIVEDHHVYINLTTQKVFVLPDGYEVMDPSLDDIKYLLFPTFTPTTLSSIDNSLSPAYDLSQNPYYPGFVGLNNIKANSYMNAIIHALTHVVPLRDYFILNPAVSAPGATELVTRFSMICRKIWNPRAFKAQVSPHELLQECSNVSGNRFKITEVGDPLEFLSWLLNQLHKDLGGTKKAKSSIIYSAFQGEVLVEDQNILTVGQSGAKPRFDIDRDVKSFKSAFLFLALDLPMLPVFQDAVEKNIIPQVSLSAILSKYNGISAHESKGVLRRYKLANLPPFLILHIKRFTKNNFVEEKNATIVNFPLRGIDMSEYLDSTSNVASHYDLVSNITHSSAAGTAREETTWKTQVHLRPARDSEGNLLENKTEDEEKWFQIQDLVVEEINRGMISLGESYIQIWERRTAPPLTVNPSKFKS